MREVCVFSSDLIFIEIVSQFFQVKKVFIDKTENIQLIHDWTTWYGAEIEQFEMQNASNQLYGNEFSGDLALTFGFNHIFGKSEIESFESGIWNFHPGKLPEYRGRHPISWALREGQTRIWLTIHSIDEKIDRGLKIAEASVPRLFTDTEVTIRKKLMDLLLGGLMNEAIQNENEGITSLIPFSPIRLSLIDGVEIFDFKDYQKQEIFNLFRAQESFTGVKYHGEVFYSVHKYLEKQPYKFGSRKVECKDGYLVLLP